MPDLKHIADRGTEPLRILWLGYTDCPLIKWLRDQGEHVTITDAKIGEMKLDYDLAISYGYRYIIRKNVLDQIPIINLHISLLPWNRGANPNFWSWVDGSPKGVSIHLMDEGIDTGPILVQKEVKLSTDDTLRGTYGILQEEIQDLFIENWKAIKSGKIQAVPQRGRGSYHSMAEFRECKHLLSKDWDTPVSELYNRCSEDDVT